MGLGDFSKKGVLPQLTPSVCLVGMFNRCMKTLNVRVVF